MRHYYGIWHVFDARTKSDGDRLRIYDDLKELETAVANTCDYDFGAVTRCSRDYARRNFDENPECFNVDDAGYYQPAKFCYTD